MQPIITPYIHHLAITDRRATFYCIKWDHGKYNQCQEVNPEEICNDLLSAQDINELYVIEFNGFNGLGYSCNPCN